MEKHTSSDSHILLGRKSPWTVRAQQGSEWRVIFTSIPATWPGSAFRKEGSFLGEIRTSRNDSVEHRGD